MATTNRRSASERPSTYEGGPARIITSRQQLERSVNSCLLWEREFYEDGETIAERIRGEVAKVTPDECAEIALRARGELNLRHVPLWIAVAMIEAGKEHRERVRDLLGGGVDASVPGIIQRPDEAAEFLSLYWKDGKRPLPASVKRGLADAVRSFDAYALAKWKGAEKDSISLRDVLRLVHPKPRDEDQAATFKGIVDGTLAAPDTWEVALSAGADKKETFERLLREKKLPDMALLMNLRGMVEAKVDLGMIFEALASAKFRRVLPFRFITAERHAPTLSSAIEAAMLRATAGEPKLSGKTLLLVDVSGSMDWPLSGGGSTKPGEAIRMDCAASLAIHAREVCGDDVAIFTFSSIVKAVPSRRGFGLRDAIVGSQPHGGTLLGSAIEAANANGYDRLIVFTDEQSAQSTPDPLPGTRAYMVNVASAKNGVGYGRWIHVDGFSAAILRWIRTYEGGEDVVESEAV